MVAQRPYPSVGQALDLAGISALFAAAAALCGALLLDAAPPLSTAFLFDVFLGAITVAATALLLARAVDIFGIVRAAPYAHHRRVNATAAPVATTLAEPEEVEPARFPRAA